MLPVLLLVGFLTNLVVADEVCYGDLGCFTNDPPYDNTGRFLPESPEDIDVSFILLTRSNLLIPTVLVRNDTKGLAQSNFDPTKPTKFTIHGYTDDGLTAWAYDMAKALVERDDINAFSVNWRKGAGGINYWQCAENARVAGAEVAAFMKQLRDQTGASFKDMHLIGHSLGAHVAGYAGERTPGLGRITGSDPAQPLFEYKDPRVRLDSTDADFVDVIHTDGNSIFTLGLGLFQPIGHIDFYPNGGKRQAGCAEDENSPTYPNCDHSRSHKYIMESIVSDCPFTAYPCTMWEIDNDPSACNYCPHGQCAYLGINADKGNTRGVFYLETNTESPYCLK
ncbi:inactive pancreatic lipase-related protein 1-like [Ptychodera flava]|uniref:inactive pancreatic lipase-related protein 1-like n=1 Tax=Ptychodera flava TaxID=63121 RepID=UPI00396A9D29